MTVDPRPGTAAPLSRRAFLGSLGLAAGGVLIGGCAPDEAAAPDGEAQVTLDWSFWASFPAEREVWEEIQADVQEQLPNIRLELDTVAFGDYWDRLLTQLAAGTQADIIGMQAQRMPGFAVRGALRPLDELIQQDDIDYEDFFDPIQEALSFEGNIHALAYDLGPPILFYNKELFEAAGLEFPSPSEPMPWERFRELALQLTNPDENQFGFSIAPTFGWAVPFIWSAGGDYMNEDETESTMDQPEAVAGVQFLDGMISEDQSVYPITDLGTPQIAQDAFVGGNSAMHIDGPWSIVALRGEVDFDWDLAPLPAGDAGSVGWVDGSGFGISPDTDHPDEAWEALKVIVSRQSLEKVADAGRGYPARQSAVPAFEVEGEPPENFQVTEQVLNSEIAEARAFRVTTNWQETLVMLEREFHPIFLGGQDVERVLVERVKPQFDGLLDAHQDMLAEG